MKLKKLLLAGATAVALASPLAGHAASTIVFDPDGSGGGGAIAVNTFDWAPDNALAINALGSSGIRLGTPFEVVAQAKLGSFIAPGNISIAPSQEFTLVVSYYEVAIGSSVSAILVPQPSLPSFVRIYADATPDADQLAGTGYANGTLILEGSIVGGFGTFADATRLCLIGPGPCPTPDLDNFNDNDYPGVLTHVGNGSSSVEVDVTYADSDYFKSSITTLMIDAQDTGNLVVPFIQADPAAQVVGNIPVRGQNNTNGADCAPNTTCDFQFQTDNATTFNPIPEPTSLALLGLGLLGLGFARRRIAA